MNKKLLLLATVIGLQVCWILGTTARKEYDLSSGKSILLETQPVDPRDLLRGDYVILNYHVSDIPLDLFTPALQESLSQGSVIYVALRPAGKFHVVSRASTQPIKDLSSDEIVLRGLSTYTWSRSPSAVHVDYGMERYYVPEGRGNPLGKVTVEVAVPSSGNGKIKQVFVNDVPYLQAVKAPNESL